ncbi:hypothetical protein [Bradyrhizobium sp. CSS354]|jgi:hypothetical protein|uniref:hypothetical protein n=1 Tax=Bradyrhizobium sp. CSS354 TaxID=2699172 RepID=UPI0023B0D8A1|nr:hypothetical protein [Bradyrhizobium sp. CSS354]
MARRPREPGAHAGIHRGIHFSLKPNAAPGYWRYAYAVGDRARSGRVQGRLPLLAIRRVQMRIDRDMRSIRPGDAAAPRVERRQGPQPKAGLANDD